VLHRAVATFVVTDTNTPEHGVSKGSFKNLNNKKQTKTSEDKGRKFLVNGQINSCIPL